MAADLTISYNYASGNNANSGCGPASPVSGAGAYSGNGAGGGTQTVINVSSDSPNLSAIQADDILYLAVTGNNRTLFQIVSVNDTAKTITVADAPTTAINTGAPVSWSVGGKRRHYYANTSRIDTFDAKSGWTFHFEDAQAASVHTMGFSASMGTRTSPITISGAGSGISALEGGSLTHVIQVIAGLNVVNIRGLHIKVPDSRYGIHFSNTGSFLVEDCLFTGSGTVTRGIVSASSASLVINNCKFDSTIKKGITRISSRAWIVISNCLFEGNQVGVEDSGGTNLSAISTKNCIFNGCTESSIDIFAANSELIDISGCVFYNNGATYSHIAAPSSIANYYMLSVSNCVFVGAGAYAIEAWGPGVTSLRNNAYYNSTTGNVTGGASESGAITLTADPFVNAAGGDFNLNNVAGGGALLRGVSINI